MKSATLTFATIALFAELALPAQLFAQQLRFKLADVGTFGGPNAVVNGPGVRDFSNAGTYVGEADTSTPDPFAPNCIPFDPECLVQHAQKWQKGVVTDLGTLPGADLNSGTTWVSANGRFIAGFSENGLIDPLLGVPEIRAVVWQDGQIHDLGTLEGGHESFATSANSRGQVVGWSDNATADPFSTACFIVCSTTEGRAVLWQNGVMQDLGTLGGADAFPFVVNERGQITGFSYTNSSPSATTGKPTVDPFLWDNGRMIDLGTLGGTLGMPSFMNNSGQVVGSMKLAGDANSHPFFWDRGVLTDIGTFGGSNGETMSISDSGLVIGRADFPGDFVHHAFVWKDGVMVDVGVVAGDLCTNGSAINSRGQAVGTSTNCMGVVEHLFLWEDGSIHDLDSLILPGSNVQLVDVFDINDRGEIAAVGILPNGDTHAVLLIPASKDEIAAAVLPAAGATPVARLKKNVFGNEKKLRMSYVAIH
jgi:probable HAF family extracellular repeat protein